MSLTPTPSTVTQTITLTPGQQFVLPNGATIESIIATGDGTAESDCTIPDLSEYACSYFKITMDQDDNPSHPMNEEDTTLDTLVVGDSIFSFNDQKIIVSGDNPGTLVSLTVMNSYITDLALFKFTNITRVTSPDKRQIIYMYFQVPGPLLDTIELKVLDRLNPVYFKRGETDIECDEYPNP